MSRRRGYYSGVELERTARYCGLALSLTAALLAGCRHRVREVAAATPPPGVALLTGGALDLRWTTDPETPLAAAPAYDVTTAYAPFASGTLAAVDLDSGRVRWRAAVKTGVSPATGDGLVFAASGDGVAAFVAATGAAAWHRTLPGTIAAPLHWDTGWLLASFESGDLVALRASDGALMWRQSLGAIVRVPPAPALANLYVGTEDARLLALDLASGRTLWTRTLDAAASGLTPFDGELVVGTTGRYLYDVDLDSGRVRWRWRIGAPVAGGVAVDERHLYVAAFDHVLRALDRGNGNLRWMKSLPHRPAGTPVVVGTTVMVPTLSTELAAYVAATGAPATAVASAGEVAGEVHLRVGGAARGTRLVALTVERRLLAFGPRVEPAPAPIGGLPGTVVAEPVKPPTP